VLFRWGRLSVGSKQGDVTRYYQPFRDGEALMGKAGAFIQGHGLIAANKFVPGFTGGAGSCSLARDCCSGDDGIGRDRMAHHSNAEKGFARGEPARIQPTEAARL
jgi:hypothetical protein